MRIGIRVRIVVNWLRTITIISPSTDTQGSMRNNNLRHFINISNELTSLTVTITQLIIRAFLGNWSFSKHIRLTRTNEYQVELYLSI